MQNQGGVVPGIRGGGADFEFRGHPDGVGLWGRWGRALGGLARLGLDAVLLERKSAERFLLLDQYTLEHKRAVTLPLLRELLNETLPLDLRQ